MLMSNIRMSMPIKPDCRNQVWQPVFSDAQSLPRPSGVPKRPWAVSIQAPIGTEVQLRIVWA